MTAESFMRAPDSCPDPETLAVFLDGGLTTRGRDDIAAHLTTCETCYAVFLESAQTRVTAAAVVPLPWWRTRPGLATAAGLAAAAVVLLAVNLGVLSSRGPALTGLVAAVGTDRLVEPRLSGGFAHGPLRGALRSAQPSSPSVSPDVRIAAAEVEKRAAGRDSAAAAHARGIAALVVGDHDRGVEALERSVERDPFNARMLSDLAAAYLVRATATNNRDDLSRALASANRALTADRSLPEAWFNRALALERLAMVEEARTTWQGYLAIDDRSGWADEARAHLHAMDATRQP
jgi:tetratricopeptide (TPR) repeat protein